VTMKQIGAEISVNESRVSQLHARAIRRLRDALGELNPQEAVEVRQALVAFASKKPPLVKPVVAGTQEIRSAVVLAYKPTVKRQAPRAAFKIPSPRRAMAASR
jgi:hypothetical protein